MPRQHQTTSKRRSRASILDSLSSMLSSRSRAFTLIELMISIALVLLLILGVNQVFTYTTQAVGAGQAINAATRDSRAISGSFASDFAAMVAPGSGANDAPFLIIGNYPYFGFRDKKDLSSDRDGIASTIDLNHDGVEGDSNVPGEQIQPWQYNFRNHRLDVLSFFARDLFHRQTGNIGTFVDNMSSQEAWIWYGHLWLPDQNGNYSNNTLPGQGNPAVNPQNFFATQLVLGRVATLLSEKSVDGPSGTISDNAGFLQRFINRTLPYPTGTALATDLQPLAANSSAASAYGDSSPWILQDARFDIAATSINGYRGKLQSYLSNTQGTANAPYWWDQLMDGNINPQIALTSGVGSRFKCNPFIPKPMAADNMAQTTPFCLGGCSQFIVEYAGDYLTQDNNPSDANYGGITGYTSDNQIDYVIINPNTPQQRKQILWYGMPRNTSGQAGLNPYLGDVAPLYLWKGTLSSFEKTVPTFTSQGVLTSMAPGSQYICAWGPSDKPPSLIRITLTLDDPTGRLPQGLTYQYVFAVPPQ